MIQTEAIVLHAFDYRETSRIVRLATREAGVVSVMARGARRAKSRFGLGLDLFTGGVAQLALHATRDLHTLTAFEATRARPGLAASLDRFGAAAALAELCLRFAPEDAGGTIHAALSAGLDALETAPPDAVGGRTVAAGWHLVGALGLAPTLASCAACHRELDPDEAVRFAHRAGGALCRPCAALAPGARTLPADARRTLLAWAAGDDVTLPDDATRRAHQRLFREFVEEHLADGSPLRAWRAWEARRP
ncbi:MAG: hypothetical protein RL139_1549 [Gemmatimonadota bacterium]